MKSTRRRTYCAWIVLLLLSTASVGSPSLQTRGYLKHLHTVISLPRWSEWLLNSLVHNRVDAIWGIGSDVQLAAGVRNRLIYGDLVQLIPHYIDDLRKDPGFWHMSRVLDEGRSHILHSTIDRGYVDITRGDCQLRFGRHRINWGMNLVWNPNDLFNNFSYLDFDYEERPGQDAALLTWHTGAVSFLQAVYQPARTSNQSVLAGLYRWNYKGYDLQLLAGRWKEDWVLGMGWSGQISGAAFRGEWTGFHPRIDRESKEMWVASVSADYTLQNGLYGQISMLYNSAGSQTAAGGIDYFGEQYLTAKTLSRGRLNGFVQLRYPVTSLVTAEAATIHNPDDCSWYISPSLNFSLSDNIDFLIIGQFLKGDSGSEYGGDIKAYLSRLKWAF